MTVVGTERRLMLRTTVKGTVRPGLLVLSVEIGLVPRVVELVLDAPAEATRA